MDSTYKGTYGDGERIGVYYWNNTTQKNTWSESLLNKTNLNTNFINNIGEEWANKIATTTWKVGGSASANVEKTVPSTAYQNEIVNPQPGSYSTTGETEYTAKIGLMYASDYGFAASPSAWTETLANYDGNDANGTLIKTINWMYMGNYEWTISPYSSNSFSVFTLNDRGDVNNFAAGADYGSRPVLYLDASVYKIDGEGTLDKPYIIGM